MGMGEDKKQEIDLQDEDDDGPPPGFQLIINPQPPQADEDGDDGPPPGFDSVAAKPSSSLFSSDMTKGGKGNHVGPPPGWEFNSLANALPEPTSNATGIKTESNEEELDEGPPPGWETVLPHQMPPPRTPSLRSSSPVSSCIEIESKPKITSNVDNEVPPSASERKPIPEHSLPIITPPSSEVPSEYKGAEKKVRIKRPTFGNQPAASPQQKLPANQRPLSQSSLPANQRPLSQSSLPANQRPLSQSSSSEKAQLVCGKCRKLCLYTRGSKWVQCPGCQEVNFVLEAHELGQVKCGRCAVLLMYPHGAPAVQCTSCHFVTEIGAHNRRPPLSVQQAQRRGRRRSVV